MNNETILSYVNSKDIRKHLKEIGYQFSSLEAAWLISQCKRLTLSQKHGAWNELISTMPDMLIDFRHRDKQTLHDFLKCYMEVDNRWIENFIKSENSIYQFSAMDVMYYGDIGYCDNDCAFSTFENCLNAAKKEMAGCDDKIRDRFKVIITKREIDNAALGDYTVLSLNHEFNILYIDESDPSMEDFAAHNGFEEMWFAFPTPFKNGDIIYDITVLNPVPIVLEQTDAERFAKKERVGNDSSDMSVWGYFLKQNPDNIFYDNAWCYMDYEYYPIRQIQGSQRILLAVSSFLKGEIDISLCLKAYHQIMLEEMTAQFPLGEFTDTGLKLAGIEKEKYRK